MDSRRLAHLVSDALGAAFGTEDLGALLYSLARLQRPRRVVELGTGYGVSALWLALAVRDTGGHVWTVDDMGLLSDDRVREEAVAALRGAGLADFEAHDARSFLEGLRAAMGVDEQLTFVESVVQLARPELFDELPFADEALDLVFADFGGAEPDQLLRLLGCLLPRMAAASSLFIDSVPYVWPSYLVLERIAEMWSQGRVPEVLRGLAGPALDDMVRRTRLTVVHLTKPTKSLQAGTSWLKLEPMDLFPHPRTVMHGARSLERYGLDDRPNGSAGEGAVVAATHGFMLTRFATRWLDAPDPALGSATPREAAQTEEGRARVDELIVQLAGRYPAEIGARVKAQLRLELDGEGA